MIKPKVEIIIVTYNNQADIVRCLRSVQKLNYPNFSVTIVDNASNDLTLIKAKEVNSNIFLIKNSSNSGFAKANNQGMHHAFSNNANFCWLLNPDTEVTPNSLSALIVSHSDSQNIKVGLIQPIILQLQNKDLINTVGNALHYLGFGFCKDNGKKFNKQDFKQDKSIISVSGAAMLVSKSYHQEVGDFNELFFMYNEDQDYSWRGLLHGYNHVLSVNSVIFHKYSFSKNPNKMYHSEKNRMQMLMQNYQSSTLFLLSPIFIFIEGLMIVYSLKNGWFRMKIRSYVYVLRNMYNIKSKRRQIQNTRIISDRPLLRRFEIELSFSELKNSLIDNVVNPCLRVYYSLAVTHRK